MNLHELDKLIEAVRNDEELYQYYSNKRNELVYGLKVLFESLSEKLDL